MAVTMKEIAKLAGVSQPAVSAALSSSGTTKVSEEMRKRIIKIVEELNYVPNTSAQRLKGGKTKTIGIYGVPYVSVLTQSLMLEISQELSVHGYNLLSCYGDTEETAFNAMGELVAKGIDGLIITIPENPLFMFKTPPVPFVYAPPWRMDRFDFSVDHMTGTANATERLVKQGCRRIGFVTVGKNEAVKGMFRVPVAYEKLQGIRNALEKHNIAMPDSYLITHETCGFKASVLAEKVKALRLDGLICANDFIAAKLMSPLISAGLRIPDDIKIVGYDGLSLCDFTPVPLATVIQPISELARNIVKLLFERIKDNECSPEPINKLLIPEFYEAESCGEKSLKQDELFRRDTFSTIELNRRINSSMGEEK